MRKIIWSVMTSLDGFVAGPSGEFDWPLADEEFEQTALDLLNSVDFIMFGRVTYQMMANYWPIAITNPTGVLNSNGTKIAVPTEATKPHTEIAHRMNTLTKIVFSRTLEQVEWNNSRLVREIVPAEIMRLELQPGKDIVIYGSTGVASTMTELGLIDEYRIFVNPIVLGKGKPLFKDVNERKKLKLLSTKTFNSGVVGLYYERDKRN
ncbi:MAG: dihydrofolate reductase family protein [Thaumarchaeota archaeon]|nr:dihydrofolate reductase family protein [Nitrososphaerota archaeon]